MNKVAKVKLTIRDGKRRRKLTLETEVMDYDRQLGVFAYNNHLYYAGKVENKDGSVYYIAEIDNE